MFVYWVLFPLLLAWTLFGLGLGVRRLGVPFSAALLLPVGYCASIVIAAIVSWSSTTTNFTGPVLLVLGLVGWLSTRAERRASRKAGARRRQWAWILAGLGGFLAFGASVIASGKPTFTGYNQIVDIAMQMNFTQWLADHGRALPEGVSTFRNAVLSTLSTGYPGGPQTVLGGFPKVFGMDVAWAWQPYLAMVAALIVLAAYALLQQVTESRAFAAVGAFAAGQASTLISYGLIGGIKELTAVATLLTAGALLPTAATPGKPFWRAALPFTVGLAGAFSVFSLTVLPWMAIMGLGAGILIWRSLSLRDALLRGGFAIFVLLVTTWPTSIPAKDSTSFAHLMEKEVGNLANPVSRWAFTGVWFTNDHRFALEGTARTLSIAVGIVVIVLALLGLWAAWKRKAPALIIMWLASMVGMTFLIVKMGPWVEFKGIAVASPVMLLMAAAGLSYVRGSARKPLLIGAWIGLFGLVAAGVYSDVLRYGSTQLAPYDRLAELRSYGKRFAGTRIALDPDWDENAAFAMRDANLVQAFNYAYEPTDAYDGDRTQLNMTRQWDLDSLKPEWVTSFDLIVMRRSPGQSRPPRQFHQVAQGKYFTVWQKANDAPVQTHIALTGVSSPEELKQCKAYVKSLPPKAEVTIAPGASYIAIGQLDPSSAHKGVAVAGGSVSFGGKAGTVKGTVDTGAYAGPFEVYATAVSHRPTSVTIDGHRLDIPVDPSAAIRGQYLGTVNLTNGIHPLSVSSEGTSLGPGTARRNNLGGYVDGIQLIPAGSLHAPLLTTTADQAQCPVAVDWVEGP